MVKRQFVIALGSEKINVEGHQPKNVAVKYLMKRRRSLLMTRDKMKVEHLWESLPQTIKILGNKATEAELITFCKQHIGNFKVPRSIEFREEPLPLSGAGKVLKGALREAHEVVETS